MILSSFLFLSLAAVTVAHNAVDCLNGGSPNPNGTEMAPCDCGELFTGRFCGVPAKIYKYHTLVAINTRYREYSFEYFRNESLAEEPESSTQQITIYQEYQIEKRERRYTVLFIKDLGYEFKSRKDADAFIVKLNGKRINWYLPYRGIRSPEGKVVLEVTFPISVQHLNIKVVVNIDMNWKEGDDDGFDYKNPICPFCVDWRIPLEISDRFVIDSSAPMPIHINASKTAHFKNTYIERMAHFEFTSKNGDVLRLNIENFPGMKENIHGFQIIVTNPRLRYFDQSFLNLVDADPNMFQFFDKIMVWILFEYENKPDENGFVRGVEQLADFQFSVDKQRINDNL